MSATWPSIWANATWGDWPSVRRKTMFVVEMIIFCAFLALLCVAQRCDLFVRTWACARLRLSDGAVQKLAMRFADQAIVVTNPEISSVRDSDRIIGLLNSRTRRAESGDRIDKQLLLTRFAPARSNRGEMLSVADVLEILSIPLLGVIPESKDILRASNLGAPVTINGSEKSCRARLSRSRPPSRRRDCAHLYPRGEEDVL